MRRAFRVTFLVISAFLLQTTALSYFKMSGVMLDLLAILVCAAGYACGMYVGMASGLLAALLMEVMAGDLHGLMMVTYVGAGAYGAWVAGRLSEFTRVGNRMQERLVKRFAPMLAIGLFIIAKETIYVMYFYLSGVDITFMHIFRVAFAGLETVVFSLPLLPLTYWFLLRKPEDTILAKWFTKRKREEQPRPVIPAMPIPPLPDKERAADSESVFAKEGQTFDDQE